MVIWQLDNLTMRQFDKETIWKWDHLTMRQFYNQTMFDNMRQCATIWYNVRLHIKQSYPPGQKQCETMRQWDNEKIRQCDNLTMRQCETLWDNARLDIKQCYPIRPQTRWDKDTIRQWDKLTMTQWDNVRQYETMWDFISSSVTPRPQTMWRISTTPHISWAPQLSGENSHQNFLKNSPLSFCLFSFFVPGMCWEPNV